MSKIVKKISSISAQQLGVSEFLKDRYKQLLVAEKMPTVYVAAMPKSAGTFICKTIAEKHKIPYIHYSDRKGCCEFDIYYPELLQKLKSGGIVHQHTLGTEGNIHYLKTFNIPCVVLTRNIFDALFSFYEHLEMYNDKWPIFEFAPEYKTWETKRKLDFIIAMVAPWFFQFYVSWYRVWKSKTIEVHWISYETFTENNLGVIHAIETLLKIDTTNFSKSVDLPHSGAGHRYNKGVTGRGVENLSDKQKDQIRQMASFYNDVDFGSILN